MTTQPEISIIVLNWNKSALTLKCLESVRLNVTSNSYEIIIIDNGSEPDELARLKEGLEANSVLISLGQNVFFGEGNNIGAEAARGKFLLFLNNDVAITPGSMDGLLAHYKSSFSPGAIGPKFLYPNGLLQEAGAFALPSGTVQQGKSNIQPNPHFASGVHIVDYCSAACLLVEKATFMKHGGFDPIFDPAYFEDVDLCLRLRASGLYTYYASEISVYHEENVTSAALWSREEILAIMTSNHRKFLRRWSAHLESRLREPAELIQRALSDLDVSAPASPGPIGSVLLRSASILQDSTDCLAMLRCASALEDKYEITLAAPEICSHLRIAALCRKLGVRLSKYKIVRLTETERSSYDHTISFPNDAFAGAAPLSNLKCMQALFDSL